MFKEKKKGEPYINLSIENLTFEIIGNSYSEEISEVYRQIMEWINFEIPKLKNKLVCKFHFSIMNSISYKSILEIVLKLDEYKKKGKDIEINWHYDNADEDIQLVAEDLVEICSIPFQIIEMK